MRPKCFAATTIVLLAAVAVSIAAQDSQVRRLTIHYDCKIYEIIVRQSDLDRAPRWHANESYPPLAARSALSAAKQYATKLISVSGVWPIIDVSLEPVGGIDQWIYIVYFDVGVDPSDPIGRLSGPFRVAILMDGTPVQAKIRLMKPGTLRKSKLDA